MSRYRHVTKVPHEYRKILMNISFVAFARSAMVVIALLVCSSRVMPLG